MHRGWRRREGNEPQLLSGASSPVSPGFGGGVCGALKGDDSVRGGCKRSRVLSTAMSRDSIWDREKLGGRRCMLFKLSFLPGWSLESHLK